MGKATGLVAGRGGSQHIHWRNFYSNGIQGGILPVATGMALAEKSRRTGQVVLVFAGDGTLGEGVFYESLNLAALWKLPLLFIVENNRYAQTTPIQLAVAGSIAGRFAAFGIPTWERETTDVLEVQSLAREALSAVRSTSTPGALILQTYRFAAHSKGDDVRDPAEIASAREKDPLTVQAPRLSQTEREQAEKEVHELITDAFCRADADPLPDLEGHGPRP
jgi:TPP-dependent pyruvate/acetoin dehydrogenase alpha subunit